MIPIRCRFLGFFLILTLVVAFTSGGARVVRALTSGPNTWTTVAPLPEARMNPAAASSDGRLYVFGGFGCSTNFCGTFDAFDPKVNRWTFMGAMPTVLSGLVSATTGPDGDIYIYGWPAPVQNPAPPPPNLTPPPPNVTPPPVPPSSGPPPSASGGVVLVYNPRANAWSNVAPPPSVVDSPTLVTGLDGRIYAVGGRVHGALRGTLSAYDLCTHSWTDLQPFPTPRQSPGVTVGPDGRIYVIGGIQIGMRSTRRSDRVEAYEPRTNTWSAVAALPTLRAELQPVTGPDGRIYAIGGTGRCFTAPCNVVEAYDVRTRSWTSVTPLPDPRWFSAAALGPDGRIYELGGNRDALLPGSLLTAVDAYTVVPGNQPLPTPEPGPTSVAGELAPMPTGRQDLAAVAGHDGRIYARGGAGVGPGDFGPPGGGPGMKVRVLRTVEAYTISTNRWTAIASMPYPRWAFGAALGPDGRVYVVGGTAARENLSDNPPVGVDTVEIYDPRTRRWSLGRPMPDGHYALSVVTGMDGRIYTIGGFSHCAPGDVARTRRLPRLHLVLRPFQTGPDICPGARIVRAYDPRTNTWKQLPSLPVEMAWSAAAVGSDGRIYAFGSSPDASSAVVYDPRTNHWSLIAPMIHTRGMGFAAARARDGRIDLIGGCVGSDPDHGCSISAPSPVDAYDPRTDTWKTIGSTLNSRIGLAATSGPDGRIYAVGGAGDGNGRLLEVIPPR